MVPDHRLHLLGSGKKGLDSQSVALFSPFDKLEGFGKESASVQSHDANRKGVPGQEMGDHLIFQTQGRGEYHPGTESAIGPLQDFAGRRGAKLLLPPQDITSIGWRGNHESQKKMTKLINIVNILGELTKVK